MRADPRSTAGNLTQERIEGRAGLALVDGVDPHQDGVSGEELISHVVGERLVTVQLDGSPDIYSRPAPQLDVVFSQRFLKRFTAKGFVKNMLNPAFRDVYADPRSNGLYHNVLYIQHQYYRGSEYALGFSYDIL